MQVDKRITFSGLRIQNAFTPNATSRDQSADQ